MRRRPVDRAARHAGRAVAVCGLVLLLGLALPATGADRDLPVNLEADRVTIDDARQIAVFEGNVVLTQGSLRIEGNRMEVRQDKGGFRLGTTWGKPAHFRQKRADTGETIEGWAERIEYNARSEVMQMFDGARLKRGQDEVRGNYISYDARSELFQVTGGPKTSAPEGTKGRVRAIIQPKPNEKPVDRKPAEGTQPREKNGKPGK